MASRNLNVPTTAVISATFAWALTKQVNALRTDRQQRARVKKFLPLPTLTKSVRPSAKPKPSGPQRPIRRQRNPPRSNGSRRPRSSHTWTPQVYGLLQKPTAPPFRGSVNLRRTVQGPLHERDRRSQRLQSGGRSSMALPTFLQSIGTIAQGLCCFSAASPGMATSPAISTRTVG